MRTVLTLSVEAVEFDTIACSLRIKGRNIQENQYVKVVEICDALMLTMVHRWAHITLLIFN